MKEHKGAMLAIKIVAAVFLLTPLVVMFIYSLADRWISILPEGFTVSYYISILTNPAFLMGIVRGIIISAIPVIITNSDSITVHKAAPGAVSAGSTIMTFE